MTALSNKSVVITRALHQSDSFAEKLKELGAIPLVYPCVEFSPPQDTAILDANIVALFTGAFDWLILTSQNTVEAIAARKRALGIRNALPKTLKIAAIGPSTALSAMRVFGVEALVIPQTYNSESFSEALYICGGERVFLPQSALAGTFLADAIEKLGAFVTPVHAYFTKSGSGGIPLVALVKQNKIDVITFASPSAVRFFVERFLQEGGNFELLSKIVIACIGNVTCKAALDHGFGKLIVPNEHTVDGLIQRLNNHFLESDSESPRIN